MIKFYITTTLPYVNAKPHIGFALEIIQADVIARYRRQCGDEVFFNTGTDEHGLKIYRKAQEEGKDPQQYCNECAADFDNLKQALNLSYNNFIRTTDEHHIKAAQEFWRRCEANGDIYKKNYKVKYCVGCELEKTESELVDNKCPIHPNLEIELIDEENYFFKYSNYQDKLLKLYKDNSDFVIPAHRLKEINSFTEQGLEDFSISRLKEKMPWGVPVPDDDNHVMYVWFDALVNYISAIGWPDNMDKFNDFWPGVQVAGKDNLRQQASMWQAMLLSAGVSTSKQIMIHGFITANGQKMSKSLGNVVDPYELVDKYGTDAVRYYLLAEFSPFEDGDFTLDKFITRYNADLANGYGNAVARITNLIEKNNIIINLTKDSKWFDSLAQDFDNYRYDLISRKVSEKLQTLDVYLSEEKPWKQEDRQKISEVLDRGANELWQISQVLLSFIPESAQKVLNTLEADKITKAPILFPRLEK